jgi:hypothetical protein
LQQESRHLRSYMNDLAQHSPYRQANVGNT